MTKQERANKAYEHFNYISVEYFDEIKKQIANTKQYSFNSKIFIDNTGNEKTSFTIINQDSVTALFNEAKGKTCVLNYASYKYPGGYFLGGSSAQEEALCHESTLYPALKAFDKDFYAWNRLNLNKALYRNRALYTSDIIFERGDKTIEADVLTCAAPNYGAARKYQHVTREENSKVLADRIRFMYEVASDNKVETLILGAWGCGVFKQEPVEVCQLLTEISLFNKKFGIKNIIYAIPDSKSSNYRAFKNTLNLIQTNYRRKNR